MSRQVYTTMQRPWQHALRLRRVLLPFTTPHSTKRTASIFTANDPSWKKESIAARNSHNRPFNDRLSCRWEQKRHQQRQNTMAIYGEPQIENRIKKIVRRFNSETTSACWHFDFMTITPKLQAGLQNLVRDVMTPCTYTFLDTCFTIQKVKAATAWNHISWWNYAW
jgi:hypothetical protein